MVLCLALLAVPRCKRGNLFPRDFLDFVPRNRCSPISAILGVNETQPRRRDLTLLHRRWERPYDLEREDYVQSRIAIAEVSFPSSRGTTVLRLEDATCI